MRIKPIRVAARAPLRWARRTKQIAAGSIPGQRSIGHIWLAIGIGDVLFRTVQLFIVRDVPTGLVWAAKILTDPLHNVAQYYKSWLALLRGEWVDPTIEAVDWTDDAEEAPTAALEPHNPTIARPTAALNRRHDGHGRALSSASNTNPRAAK